MYETNKLYSGKAWGIEIDWIFWEPNCEPEYAIFDEYHSCYVNGSMNDFYNLIAYAWLSKRMLQGISYPW